MENNQSPRDSARPAQGVVFEDEASGSMIYDRTAERFVFIRRDNIPSIPWPNMIGIAGGGMEPGETPEEACRRELGEELRYAGSNAPVEVGPLALVTSFINKRGTRVHMHFTEIEDTSNLVVGDEGTEIVRFTRSDMIAAARAGEFADEFNKMILTYFSE